MWGFSVGVVACFGLLIFLFSFLYVYSSGLAGSLSCVKGVGGRSATYWSLVSVELVTL